MTKQRTEYLIRKCIEDYSLNLKGLTVLTEAASGPYATTAPLAALSGAHVIAIAADSIYGKCEDVIRDGIHLSTSLGIRDRIEYIQKGEYIDLSKIDLVTNTGFVRPINDDLIKKLPKHAAISLMWETWEWRKEELDLDSCKKHEILCLGTDESKSPLLFSGYLGACAIKLIFDLGLEFYKSEIMIIGDGLGNQIKNYFNNLNINVTWCANSDLSDVKYEEFSTYWSKNGAQYDAIILAEHKSEQIILGESGMLKVESLVEKQPAIKVGVISGVLDVEELRSQGILVLPNHIAPAGYMSFQPAFLGERPVIELHSAGLKVGQEMVRARLKGLSLEDSIKSALLSSPAMDFPKPHNWL